MTAAAGAPARRLRWLLFLFLLSALLLGGRRGFFNSDGRVAFRAGEALLTRGAIDLPPRLAADDPRYVLGRDGRAYSIFGIGASLQFAAASAADRALARLVGETGQPAEGEGRPGFFATQANVPVVALTGVVLFTLLLDFGLALPAALLGSLLGVLGTMVAVYATLSFDMSLANLGLLAGALFFFRACRGASWPDALLAGAALGAGVLTRITTVIFLPVLAIHAVLAARAHGAGGARRLLRPAAAFVVPLAAALLVVAWYNVRRFGSPLATGYTEANSAARFDASLLESVPALLVSPGRGIFFFAPLLLLALPGVRALLRARRAEGRTVLLLAAVNFLFFAANRNWATAFRAWGPRFQLTTMLLLAVPLAFAIERARASVASRSRALWAALFLAAVGLQAVVLAAGTPNPAGRKRLWTLADSQVTRSALEFASLLREGAWSGLELWWTGPWYRVAPLRALFWGAAVTAAATGVLLAREIRRSAPAGAAAAASRPE